MNKGIVAGVLLLLMTSSCREPEAGAVADAGETDPYALVDPFIGTGGHGHTHPAATLPFGMIQAGPDTRLEGWDGCSGYHYDDDTIYGFSQTHLSGTGVSDYGDVLLMPFDGGSTERLSGDYPYRAGFSHANEAASPGLYSVVMDNGIVVDIAANERSASYRVIFPAGVQPALWVDLAHRDQVVDHRIRMPNDSCISGFRISNAWAEGQQVYFWLESDRLFQKEFAAGFMKPKFANNERAPFIFRRESPMDQPDTLYFRIAISAVDEDGARKNLEAEWLPSHDAYRAQAESVWREVLDRAVVYGGTEAQRRTFYTAHYHALLAPSRFDDADGRYRGMDHTIHDAQREGGPGAVYTVFSLWDTYRAAHPWYSLVHPQRNAAFAQSLLDDYQTGGALPIWKLADWYTGCMIGYHAIPVLVDAWAKGQLPSAEDQALALEAMVHSAELPRLGLPAYMEHGYIPADREAESVSKTLEYAYDDACIAAMARSLSTLDQTRSNPAQPLRLKDGRTVDAIARLFAQRAGAFTHLYDPESGFFRARRNSGFIEPFHPAEVNLHYTEANAWHYAFAAVQDLEGFAALSGGKERLLERLDACFAAASQTSGREQADITGLIGQYAHGNEPSHHVAYLYALLGEAWKTQQRVREICTQLYSDQADGYCGNEDCGQMSAWYLFSAAGFYPVRPGMPTYTIGSPLFDSVRFAFGEDRVLTVVAEGNGPEHPFIQSAHWNGEAFSDPVLSHHELVEGGRLVLAMGAKPKRSWGLVDRGIDALAKTDPTLPAPYAVPAPRSFTDAFEVELRCADADARIEWQRLPGFGQPGLDHPGLGQPGLDHPDFGQPELGQSRFGQPDPAAWQPYGPEPLRIEQTQRIAFRAVAPASSNRSAGSALADGTDPVHADAARDPSSAADLHEDHQRSSPIVYAHFKKRDDAFRLHVDSRWAPQYAAGGQDALIDGIPGGPDWRTGDWQGYEGQDLNATLDLGTSWSLDSFGVDFLQDENAWIFYPSSVAFAVSEDGETWTPLGQVAAPVDWQAKDVRRHRFGLRLQEGQPRRIRYIRMQAESLEQCPEGHKGAGYPCWVFADEWRVYGLAGLAAP